jgi:hypothetical protein
MRITTPRLALSLVAIGAAATAAQAATPEGGEVSSSKPSASWSGALFNSAPQFNAWEADPSAPCAGEEQCDPYELKVANAGSVTISIGDSAAPSNGTAAAGYRITKPDKTHEFVYGDSSLEVPFTYTMDVKPGTYTLHAVDSVFGCCAPHDYTGGAKLESEGGQAPSGGGQTPAGNNPAPPSGGGTPPAGGDPAPAQPAPAQTQAPSSGPQGFTLTAKAPKVSARKARKAKGFRVRVTTSRPIQKLTATLKKGTKTVGTGTVANFKGSGAVKLKVKRLLKRGTYQLVLVGNDSGIAVARTLKLEVRS